MQELGGNFLFLAVFVHLQIPPHTKTPYAQNNTVTETIFLFHSLESILFCIFSLFIYMTSVSLQQNSRGKIQNLYLTDPV